MDDFVEKQCSYCRKFNWDNQTGPYNEKHERNGKTEPCDTNGTTFVNGVAKS